MQAAAVAQHVNAPGAVAFLAVKALANSLIVKIAYSLQLWLFEWSFLRYSEGLLLWPSFFVELLWDQKELCHRSTKFKIIQQKVGSQKSIKPRAL